MQNTALVTYGTVLGAMDHIHGRLKYACESEGFEAGDFDHDLMKELERVITYAEDWANHYLDGKGDPPELNI